MIHHRHGLGERVLDLQVAAAATRRTSCCSNDNGWSYERAQRWLVEQASRELLAAPTGRRGAA